LVGGEGADRLDGGLNTEALNGVFFEELLGAGGDDQLVYRGFSGDLAVTDVKALLQGGAGRDVLDVMLDGRTSIQVSGGDGFDGLVLQTLVGPASPWDSSFAQWHWDVSTGTALLNAAHVNGEQSGSLSETTPDLEWLASGASTPLTLVRPEESAVAMRGTEGADWILAGPQVSTIQAMGGDDVVLAKAGVTVDLGAGINTLYADSADFTLTYADAPFGVRVNLANRLGLVFDEDAQLHAIDRLMDVPLHVVGSAHADVLVGDSANNTLRTGGGADELWGGAGADHFVVDVGSGSGPVRVADWNFAEGDHLSLNLTDWDTLFSRFEVRNEQDQTLWSGEMGDPIEEGALLSLMLSAETDTLYWTDAADQPFAWVSFDAPVDSLSAEQWASVLSVDYL
jgi:Ca2+-binding RTX toxin-like protein